MDNEILLELLKSYIEEHEISTREILEAVNNSASYLLKDITKELVKKTSKRFEETAEPEENYDIPDDPEDDDDEEEEEEEEEKKTEHVEIPKPNIRIIGTFKTSERFDELDEIPRLENGEVDYWKASKMLCEKDGGRLPTMKELAEIASYMYQTKIDEFEDKYDLKVINKLIPFGGFWSSTEVSANAALRRVIYSDGSTWGEGYRDNGYVPLCVGD